MEEDHLSRDPARRRSKSTSARGTERSAREREVQGPLSEATASARSAAAAALRAAPPPTKHPQRAVHPPPATQTGAAETPHRPQQASLNPPAAESHLSTPAPTPPEQSLAKRPTRSPKSDLESDYIIMARLAKADMISGDLAKAIAMHLNDRQHRMEREGIQTPTEEELEEAWRFAALTPIPTAAPGTLKRQRTEHELLQTVKQPRVGAADAPLPQRERDPRVRNRPTAAPRVVPMDTAEGGPSQAPASQPSTQPTAQQKQRQLAPKDDARPSTSFADVTRTPASAANPQAPSQGPAPPPSGPAPGAAASTKPKTPRYPPLIVEVLPNWAHHLRRIKELLGRAPNARPFGKGIKFVPTEDQEYRIIQRYLGELEKTEKISWFSYSLPQDRSLKVAIRGVPVETDPDEIADDLRTQGFEPELVRPIKARKGRPGCIFFAVLKRTPTLVPAIYQVSEILCMPGVHIEAWRGKKGPAQCHRCQKFRHSSHNCHRQLACVRCGEEHSAHECPRPREEPATCANCGGPHPANNMSCPIFRREAKNKRAGTVAATTTATASTAPGDAQTSAPPTTTTGSIIRTPANEPQQRGSERQSRKRKPRKKKAKKATPPNPKTETDATTNLDPDHRTANSSQVLQMAIETLKEVLEALHNGKPIVPVVLRGLQNLLSSK